MPINRSPRTVPQTTELPSPLSISPGSLPRSIMHQSDFGSRLTRRSNSCSAEPLPRVPEGSPDELDTNIISELPAGPVPDQPSFGVGEDPLLPELASSHRESVIELPEPRPVSTISSPGQHNPARGSLGSIPNLILPQPALPYTVAEV
jgi:hypothetical protein